MQRTIVVIPCFNEARRLHAHAFQAFLERCEGVSLLFVNDGSKDGTLPLLQRIESQGGDRVRVLDLPQNVGKAEAVRQGVLAAFQQQPAHIGYWDADLATPLEAIPQFRDVLEQRSDLRLVMGSRIPLLGRSIERHPIRKLLGRTFAAVASRVLGLSVYDTQCGAKMFRATPEVESLFQHPFRSRWIFDVELLARMIHAWRAGYAREPSRIIYEIPLDRWHDVAGSKLKSGDFAKALMELASIYTTYLAGHRQPDESRSPADGTGSISSAAAANSGPPMASEPAATERESERRRAA